MISIRQIVVSTILSSMIAVPTAHAGWQEPKDGVMTEKQLVNYLQVVREAMDKLKAAGKAVEASPSGAAAMAVYLNGDSKFQANLTSQGMSQAEYGWIGDKTMEAWGILAIDQMMAEGQKGLAEQRKTNEQKIADLKQKLAVYQKAQTEGRKVMSKEDRESAVQSAKADQQSALEEVKQHADEAMQALEDAVKADAEAKVADGLAKTPPADVTADDRPGFIDQKKAEAQAALDAAKEALEKEAEAKKLQDESVAKAASAGKKISDPDLPLTDDEKAQVKKENNDEVMALKTDISEGEQGLKLLDESAQTYAKAIQEQKDKNPVPQQNVDLLKKHRAEFEAVWGFKTDKK